ncbi:MAG: rhodanese-like domain-containing protein [Verrucomicrobiae bacterium]|nr:rhodanese-like domain-containing protein [Verrucomicrobiae bacterium]NNJ43101.1 rhodanese-like domain-containing protein [Akkermansiaceae bacterium]
MKHETLSLLGLMATSFWVSCADPAAPTKPVPPQHHKAAGAQITSVRPTTPPAQVAKHVPMGQITSVDIGQLFTMMQEGRVRLVDCRPSLIFHIGHLEGAMSLPLRRYDTVIGERRQRLDEARSAQKVIVLYCQNTHCPDAYRVAQKLVRLGYSVSIYKGGWEEWKHAGL